MDDQIPSVEEPSTLGKIGSGALNAATTGLNVATHVIPSWYAMEKGGQVVDAALKPVNDAINNIRNEHAAERISNSLEKINNYHQQVAANMAIQPTQPSHVAQAAMIGAPVALGAGIGTYMYLRNRNRK